MVITIFEHQRLLHRRLFIINLHGTFISVTVTASADIVQDWISSVLRRNRSFLRGLVVGIGVQWVPFAEYPPASTLQLCVGRRCLIYQLNHSDYDVPLNLQIFLRHPCNIFVGFNTFWYRKNLWNAGVAMRNHPLDLKMYVRFDDNESLKRASLEEIVERCLGISGVCITSEITRSDWGVLMLSDEQVLQAALLAFCSYKIGTMNMKAWEIQRLSS